LVHRVEHFAIDIQLELAAGGVANPHRAGPCVPREPVQLQLRQAALASQPIHDVRRRWPTRRCPQQPAAPRPRFLPVAGVQERVEGEGGIPEPAVAVVPVAYATELLGQRGRGRGDHAPGRHIG
jgi:hypothetical protein